VGLEGKGAIFFISLQICENLERSQKFSEKMSYFGQKFSTKMSFFSMQTPLPKFIDGKLTCIFEPGKKYYFLYNSLFTLCSGFRMTLFIYFLRRFSFLFLISIPGLLPSTVGVTTYFLKTLILFQSIFRYNLFKLLLLGFY
jgi:hypothetical protein